MPEASRPESDEQGSTLLLTIFYAFFALVLVVVVIAASSLYLERKRLFTVADGAALAGAEAWSLEAVTIDDAGERLDLQLQSEAVGAAVAAYLADAGLRTDVTVVEAVSRDGTSATVTLRSEWHAPISTELLPVTVPIEVTATARSVFH